MRPQTPPPLKICILAGGLSQRMGRDKSRLRLGPRTMLGQIRATAKRLDLPVCIIRRDAVPRCGPLGGIYTALKSSSADAVMFLACDMPLVSEALLRVARQRFARQGGSLFVRSEGRPGFPFVLRREALVTVARQIAAKRFSLHELARALRAKSFSAPANQRAQLRNVNTPGEWARVVKKWGQGVKRGT